MISKVFAVFAVAVFALAGAFCPPPVKNRNIICLVDFSSVKNDAARQQFYKTVIRDKILKNAARTDRIVVLPLDAASLTNAQEILIEDFGSRDFSPDLAPPMEEEKLTEKAFQQALGEVVARFDQKFGEVAEARKDNKMGTDIFGVISNLGRYLKDDKRNYVVFLSDMMNYSPALKMEPANKEFSAATMEENLKKVPQTSLGGAGIFVLTGETAGQSPEHFSLVKNFWTGYFSRNGGEIADYGSASISKIDEMMKMRK